MSGIAETFFTANEIAGLKKGIPIVVRSMGFANGKQHHIRYLPFDGKSYDREGKPLMPVTSHLRDDYRGYVPIVQDGAIGWMMPAQQTNFGYQIEGCQVTNFLWSRYYSEGWKAPDGNVKPAGIQYNDSDRFYASCLPNNPVSFRVRFVAPYCRFLASGDYNIQCGHCTSNKNKNPLDCSGAIFDIMDSKPLELYRPNGSVIARISVARRNQGESYFHGDLVVDGIDANDIEQHFFTVPESWISKVDESTGTVQVCPDDTSGSYATEMPDGDIGKPSFTQDGKAFYNYLVIDKAKTKAVRFWPSEQRHTMVNKVFRGVKSTMPRPIPVERPPEPIYETRVPLENVFDLS